MRGNLNLSMFNAELGFEVGRYNGVDVSIQAMGNCGGGLNCGGGGGSCGGGLNCSGGGGKCGGGLNCSGGGGKCGGGLNCSGS
jgi:hypothetical protein